MKKIHFSALIFFFLFNTTTLFAQQCGSCNKRTHFRFRLLKKGLSIDTNHVKINGVYIVESSFVNQRKRFGFMRFFSNGRIYSSCDYWSVPDDKELDNLRYGSYGYYRVDSNIVTVESYSSAGGYYFFYYYLEQNELIFKSSRGRVFNSKEQERSFPYLIYKFHPCIVSSTPFW